MNSSTRQTLPLGVIIAAAVVVVASFMPWIAVNIRTGIGFQIGDGPDLHRFLPTAWNSHATYFGMTTPNWSVVAASLAAAAVAWTTTAGMWAAPKSLLLGLPIYGMCHTGLLIFKILDTPGRGLGMGIVLTFMSFAGMYVAIRKVLPQPKGAYILPEDPVRNESFT